MDLKLQIQSVVKAGFEPGCDRKRLTAIVRLRNEIIPGRGYTGNDLYFLLTKRCVTWRLTMGRNCYLYNLSFECPIACLHKFNTWLIRAVFRGLLASSRVVLSCKIL